MNWTLGKAIDPWLEEVKKAVAKHHDNLHSVDFIGPKNDNLLEFRARFHSANGPTRYIYSSKSIPCAITIYDHKMDCLCGACQGAI
jgi:hypothetical protein